MKKRRTLQSIFVEGKNDGRLLYNNIKGFISKGEKSLNVKSKTIKLVEDNIRDYMTSRGRKDLTCYTKQKP